MHRTAVFVDAGYLYSQSAVCLSGSNAPRQHLRLDESELVNQLKSLALTAGAGAQLLRIYWYDGAKNGMTVEQLVLADMQDVKVRLGSINSAGEQKGVDSLLITDLIELARNNAIGDALIVTGDSDMRVGVQIAQSFGVRVHLVGLEPSSASQSVLLRHEADTVHEIPRTDVAKFMKHAAPTASPVLPVVQAAASGDSISLQDAIDRSIQLTFAALPQAELEQVKLLIQANRNIPREYDSKLLGTCGALLGRTLGLDESRKMRKAALVFLGISTQHKE